jgi:hypothetical protein
MASIDIDDGPKSNENTVVIKMVSINAGASRTNLRLKKVLIEKSPLSKLSWILLVITNPDITKNISTPK